MNIARQLLDRRNAMNPVVMPGEIIAQIGSEGMQEALQKRWLVAVPETGFLQVSQDMTRVLEMRAEAAKEEPKAPAPTEAVPAWKCESASHAYAVGHSVHPLNELLSPGTGKDSAPMGHTTPANPVTPTAAADRNKPTIGDTVTVAENGKSFTGTVSKSENGKYQVSFAQEKPTAQREYGESEVKLVKKSEAPR